MERENMKKLVVLLAAILAFAAVSLPALATDEESTGGEEGGTAFVRVTSICSPEEGQTKYRIRYEGDGPASVDYTAGVNGSGLSSGTISPGEEQFFTAASTNGVSVALQGIENEYRGTASASQIPCENEETIGPETTTEPTEPEETTMMETTPEEPQAPEETTMMETTPEEEPQTPEEEPQTPEEETLATPEETPAPEEPAAPEGPSQEVTQENNQSGETSGGGDVTNNASNVAQQCQTGNQVVDGNGNTVISQAQCSQIVNLVQSGESAEQAVGQVVDQHQSATGVQYGSETPPAEETPEAPVVEEKVVEAGGTQEQAEAAASAVAEGGDAEAAESAAAEAGADEAVAPAAASAAASAAAEAAEEDAGISELPDTGGISMLTLLAGALLVGGGLVARRIIR